MSPGREAMTICIAAICDHNNAVVVASDKMITNRYLGLEYEQPDPKFEPLSELCVGLTSGNGLAHTELFRACRQYIYQLKSPQIELITNTVLDQYVYLRKKGAEAYILQPRGLTMDQFYEGAFINKIPGKIAGEIDNLICEFEYDLSVLIAGVDSSGAHIYGINNPGVVNCFDGLGHAVLGSGEHHATYSLVGSNQSIHLGLNETVLMVYEAKKRAEMAPGVGQAVAMAIVTRNGIKHLDEFQVCQLEEIYTQKMTPKLQEIEDAVARLKFGDSEK
jgi:hypothetical protein